MLTSMNAPSSASQTKMSALISRDLAEMPTLFTGPRVSRGFYISKKLPNKVPVAVLQINQDTEGQIQHPDQFCGRNRPFGMVRPVACHREVHCTASQDMRFEETKMAGQRGSKGWGCGSEVEALNSIPGTTPPPNRVGTN